MYFTITFPTHDIDYHSRIKRECRELYCNNVVGRCRLEMHCIDRRVWRCASALLRCGDARPRPRAASVFTTSSLSWNLLKLNVLYQCKGVLDIFDVVCCQAIFIIKSV